MAVRKKKKLVRDEYGTKIGGIPSAPNIRSSDRHIGRRKADRFMGVLEEGAAKYGGKMFLVATWKGRERAYRIRKRMMDGELLVPGGAERWEFVVEPRKCRGGERSHDGKMSELHARKRRG